MTLTAEKLRRIRRIELRTRKLVNEALIGAYHSVFKGRGIEFDAVRPYEPGDDVRSIDWKVTARIGEPYIKRYVEERELTVLLVLDASASCLFGTVGQQKRDLAAELGAVLAYTALRNNDKVGLLVFSDQVEHYVSPRKGHNHILRLIRDLTDVQPAQRGTDLALALMTVNRLLKKRAVVFVMSDFLTIGDAYVTELSLTARRHDVMGVVLNDPLEQAWPNVGLVALEDAEVGHIQWVDTASETWRKAFKKQGQRFQQARKAALVGAGIDHFEVPTDGNYVAALSTFFQRRLPRSRA